MKAKRLPLEFFQLRVLLSWTGEVCWAQCLETGSVVTADNANVARSMIMALLKDEIGFAQESNMWGNLFSAPAPLGIWQTYYEWSDARPPKMLGRGVKILVLPREPVASDTGDNDAAPAHAVSPSPE